MPDSLTDLHLNWATNFTGVNLVPANGAPAGDPATTQSDAPGACQPVPAADPAATNPAAGQAPPAADPGATDPGAGQPARASDPAVDDPVAGPSPPAANPAAPDPTSGQAALAADPAAADPGSRQPVPATQPNADPAADPNASPTLVSGPSGQLGAPTSDPAGSAPEAIPAQTGPGKGAVKIGSGAVVLAALRLIPSQKPITVPGGVMGDVTLIPGANINAKILVTVAPLHVEYIDGIDLYEAYTPDFVKGLWLTAFAQGAARAAWLVPLIEAEMAFIEAFVAPMWAVAIVDIVTWLAYYDDHKAQIHVALDNFGKFNDARLELKSRFPALYDAALSGVLGEIWSNLGKGVALADVAYFVGRVLGKQGILGKFEQGAVITLKVVLFVVAEYAVLVSLLHAPGIVAGAAQAGAIQAGKDIQAKLAQGGINVSEEDAIKIAKQLADDSGAQQFLGDFKGKAEALQKSLVELGKIPH